MRSSGILMHITSLPGPYGVGTMGKQAFAFVDFLKRAGQSCWQLLPLTPTSVGDSPYQSSSSFAGNPFLIDLQLLVEEGWLKPEEPGSICRNCRQDRVDYGEVYASRRRLLRLAYSRFDRDGELTAFREENRHWLKDFALFMALKDRHGGKPWHQWEEDVKFRRPEALARAEQELAPEIRYHSFVQYLFHRQWNALHRYANEAGVTIIGDVPIYVPLDSVEVWSRPELFQLDEKLDPIAVAGCPPDAFTVDGQRWGNPLYRWEAHEKEGYQWWLNRLSGAGKLYDAVRLDHFRGFEAYWSVPFRHPTARYGKWVKGPGMAFVRALKQGLPELNMIAEDLGYLTQEVLDMRDAGGWPGMKVLQFAFDSREPSDYLPHNYGTNTVCYTGTHDNMTMRQWFETADKAALDYAAEYMRLSEEEGYSWGAIRTCFASVSDTCIIPMQDFLDLGPEARMNLPGSLSDANWTWRMAEGLLTAPLADRIANLTRLYGRMGTKTQ